MDRIVVIAAVLLSAAGARAGLITHASVRYGDASLTLDEHFGAASASAELLYTSPGLFHGIADAAAAYGTVHARANVLGVNASYPVNTAQGEGSFSDTLTISGPAGAGFVIYTYTITGHSQGDLSLGALFLRHGAEPDEELSDEVVGGEQFTSLAHAVTFGQPFTHGIVLQANAVMGLGESGEFESDLTATMTRLQVFDAAMNPIAAFSVGSESGTPYPLPAPGGVVVLAAAAFVRRRRV